MLAIIRKICVSDNYIKPPLVPALNPALLWEYDLSIFDYTGMRAIVVQRVVERGWPGDWYFILNRYGIEGVRSAVKDLPYLNDKDMNFVSHQFDIPLTSLKCYKRKRSANQYWNS